MLALCRVVPGLPPVPKLVCAGNVPEGICDVVGEWPVQTLRLQDAVVAGGGMIDAPADD